MQADESRTFEAEVAAALTAAADATDPQTARVLARPECLAGLARFCAALRRANERLNLTRITDAEGMALRHVIDSLTALRLLPASGTLADMGSGGGVPGLPLAIARPALRVTLLESRGRKAEALAGLVDELGLSPRVRVVPERAESWLAEHGVQGVVARAVGTTEAVLTLLSPVRRGFRRLVLMKGPSVDDELVAVRPQLRSLGFRLVERVETALPGDAGRRVLLAFERA
jgi:16S rRNA (guanine527-N7)-methyltransferase